MLNTRRTLLFSNKSQYRSTIITEHNNAAAPNKMVNFQYVMENNVIKINSIISILLYPNVCKSSFLYRKYIVQMLPGVIRHIGSIIIRMVPGMVIAMVIIMVLMVEIVILTGITILDMNMKIDRNNMLTEGNMAIMPAALSHMVKYVDGVEVRANCWKKTKQG